MEKATVSKLKNHSSADLRKVRGRQPLLIDVRPDGRLAAAAPREGIVVIAS